MGKLPSHWDHYCWLRFRNKIRVGKLSSNPEVRTGCDSACSWLMRRLWADISRLSYLDVLLNDVWLSVGSFQRPELEEKRQWVPVSLGWMDNCFLHCPCSVRGGVPVSRKLQILDHDPQADLDRALTKDWFKVKRRCYISSWTLGLSSRKDFKSFVPFLIWSSLQIFLELAKDSFFVLINY